MQKSYTASCVTRFPNTHPHVVTTNCLWSSFPTDINGLSWNTRVWEPLGNVRNLSRSFSGQFEVAWSLKIVDCMENLSTGAQLPASSGGGHVTFWRLSASASIFLFGGSYPLAKGGGRVVNKWFLQFTGSAWAAQCMPGMPPTCSSWGWLYSMLTSAYLPSPRHVSEITSLQPKKTQVEMVLSKPSCGWHVLSANSLSSSAHEPVHAYRHCWDKIM